ncbi:unnamed protein product [Danaus chrysippus]|uniref:(African queen) hypothetical protein n=1 Tax=Danaus chrysippus TaxID=151541 RepID=A0A8J2R2R7_9NEOP|nr:unnamed protein product [Danaus chrysippus]
MLEYQRKYVCMKCKFENTIEADFENRYILRAPTKCGNTEMRCKCSTFTQINLVSREHCRDYQEIKIQEQVNKLSIGTIPGSMWVVLEDDLVDCCKPGDDVIICGIVRRRWRPPVNNKKSEVEIVLQANYIEVSNSQKSEAIASAPDVKDCFDEFWSKYKQCPLKGRDQILSSVCPQVYGLYLVKLAVLLTVITGSNHIVETKNCIEDKHTMHVRGQCHLLLVGDPGTGKSQLLKTGAELTPRSVFTSGAGSTRAGLTCAALREDGEWQLEAGALVLSDGGVCCIDEISHLRDHDRTAIHEAMEQQTISVAKAGIVCKLNTRCAVIAACNPKGHYQRDEPLSVNVSLGTPLLSRFDLIFILLDSKNSEWDELVSTYILFGDSDVSAKNKWDIEKLQMYISLIGPRPTEITKSANIIIQTYYMMQRKSEYRDPSRTTVRMLDSLIRLSQAHCRLMYRTTILPVDAITAVSLIDLSMQDCTLDKTVDALHSTFQKYPDFEYLCTAKQLLTRLNLYEIWKEELLYYGKILQVDHKTLEHHIDTKCESLFARYDNVTDNNIPLSTSIVTSSYFKKNTDECDKNITKEDTSEGVSKKDKVINDKLAATLKKHATLNKVEKNPPIQEKKKQVRRKQKQVTVGVSDLIKSKTKKIKECITNSDDGGHTASNSKNHQADKNLKNCEDIDSLEEDFANDVNTDKQKIILKETSRSTEDKRISKNDEKVSDIGGKTVVKKPKLTVNAKVSKNSTTKIDFSLSTESDDERAIDKNANDEAEVSKISNKTLNKLNQFIFKETSDLNRFYNENPHNRSTESETEKNNLIKSIKPESSSQISMFESSDCEIDLDI